MPNRSFFNISNNLICIPQQIVSLSPHSKLVPHRDEAQNYLPYVSFGIRLIKLKTLSNNDPASP